MGAVGVVALFVTVPNPPAAAEAGRYEFDEPHMGTTARVVLYAADKATAVAAARAAFKRVAAVEQVLSDYRPGSEAMKLCAANDAAPGKRFAVSDDLARVLTTALEVSKKSDGAFDVTVGPLSQLWRQTRKTKSLPDAATLGAARAKVGFRQIELDRDGKTVRFTAPAVRLDFGGIGKGFAADEALTVLKSLGVRSALVALSGDIAVGDSPPGKAAWRVEVAPLGAGRPAKTLELVNAAVSTSGDLFQHVEIGGVRYSHVLDPTTGLGLTGFRSATVVAPSGVLADSLSKVACVLPSQKALPVVEGFGGAAFVATKADATAEEKAAESAAFQKFVAK